jgi:hypothetical protein
LWIVADAAETTTIALVRMPQRTSDPVLFWAELAKTPDSDHRNRRNLDNDMGEFTQFLDTVSLVDRDRHLGMLLLV